MFTESVDRAISTILRSLSLLFSTLINSRGANPRSTSIDARSSRPASMLYSLCCDRKLASVKAFSALAPLVRGSDSNQITVIKEKKGGEAMMK